MRFKDIRKSVSFIPDLVEIITLVMTAADFKLVECGRGSQGTGKNQKGSQSMRK